MSLTRYTRGAYLFKIMRVSTRVVVHSNVTAALSIDHWVVSQPDTIPPESVRLAVSPTRRPGAVSMD